MHSSGKPALATRFPPGSTEHTVRPMSLSMSVWEVPEEKDQVRFISMFNTKCRDIAVDRMGVSRHIVSRG